MINLTSLIFDLFIYRAAIILRVQGDGGDAIRATAVSNAHNSSRMQVPRLKMTRVHIPFTFRLLESVNTSYEGRKSTFLLLLFTLFTYNLLFVPP